MSPDAHPVPAAPTRSVAHGPAGPRMPPRLFARKALLQRLVEARYRRCTVVRGPAGSGKTTAVMALRQALQPLGFDTVWLTLTPAHDDPVQGLAALWQNLRAVAPAAFPEASPAPGRHTDSPAVEEAVVAVARGVARLGERPLLLVLDDLHTVGSAGMREALQWLVDYAPANLHLVLVSRAAVPLPLARLRAHGQLLELGARDLSFTEEESKAYLQTVRGATEHDAQALHHMSGGWFMGLQLLATTWTRRTRRASTTAPTSATAFAQVCVHDERLFDAFFEREVLSQLSESELALLTRACVCEQLCAPLCAALVGQPQTTWEIATALGRLEAAGLFIETLESDGPQTWYRLHPLLRQTLVARIGPTGLDARHLHRSAWRWFRDHGALEEAVRHAILAGDHDDAADLLEAGIDRLQLAGRQRQFVALLRMLPTHQTQTHVGLRLWRARIQLYEHDLDGCAASLAALEADAAQIDAHHRATLLRLRGNLAAQRDDIDAAVALLPQLQDLPPGAGAFEVGGRNNLLSWIHMQCGQHEAARQLQLEAPPLLVDGIPLLGTASGVLQGRCLVGLSYAMEGRMAQAEHVYREVLFETERGGRACEAPLLMATGLLGEVMYELNDPASAVALLEPRVHAMEQVSLPDSILRVMGVLALAHWALGHEPESFAYLDRLEDYGTRMRLGRLVAYSLNGQVHRHLLRGRFDAADALLVRLEALNDEFSRAGRRNGGEIETQARRARIRWFVAHGALDQAAAYLPLAIAQCEARGDLRSVARIQAQGAAIDLRRGHTEAAQHKLVEALRIGHRLGLLRSLLDSGREVPQMLRELPPESLDAVLAFYVERLVAASTASAAPMHTPLGTSARDATDPLSRLSERERDVLELAAQALPSKKIARTLGLSYTTVKWHLQNIYGKLDVSSRDEAVARWRALQRNPPGH